MSEVSPPQDPVVAFFEGGRALVEHVRRTLAEILRPGGEAPEWLQAVVHAASVWPQIEERLKQFPKEVQEAFRAAELPPWRHATLADLERITATFSEGGADAVAVLVEGMCRDYLADEGFRTRLLEEWQSNPHVAKRLPILRDALGASVGGLYSLSIPVLLTQLEGIIADGFVHVGPMGGGRYKAYIRTLAAGDRDPDADVFGPPLVDFVLKVVLVDFEHGSPLESTLSRHAILHGADTEYGTERNSLRAIMLFDYVQELLRPPSLAEAGSAPSAVEGNGTPET